jgi:hypothetical protein
LGTSKDVPGSSRPPSKTVEGRENQVVALAYDLAERQIREGTASSQVITHFLKMGTAREQLERERLQRETELMGAKVEALASNARMEDLYADAIKAMRSYAGLSDEVEYDE